MSMPDDLKAILIANDYQEFSDFLVEHNIRFRNCVNSKLTLMAVLLAHRCDDHPYYVRKAQKWLDDEGVKVNLAGDDKSIVFRHPGMPMPVTIPSHIEVMCRG